LIELPVWVRTLIATSLVGLAILLTKMLWLIGTQPISTPLFLAAIALSAWLFGLRFGVYSSVISGVAIDYFFIEPFFEFTGGRSEITRFVLLLAEGCFLSLLIGRLKTANENIRISNMQLQELMDYQQTLRESEQKRIAREIHDELGQTLTGLKLEIHLLSQKTEKKGGNPSVVISKGDLVALSDTVDSTVATVRRIASELRPPILDDLGLVPACEWQAREFERKSQIKCYFDSECDDLDLGAVANTSVFRILQEALTNVARHAEANSVHISLKDGRECVRMTITDNGKGIERDTNTHKRSLGILGMHERSRLIGGQITIERNLAEKGTSVVLSLPKDTVSELLERT